MKHCLSEISSDRDCGKPEGESCQRDVSESHSDSLEQGEPLFYFHVTLIDDAGLDPLPDRVGHDQELRHGVGADLLTERAAFMVAFSVRREG